MLTDAIHGCQVKSSQLILGSRLSTVNKRGALLARCCKAYMPYERLMHAHSPAKQNAANDRETQLLYAYNYVATHVLNYTLCS
jgi:hypothetical protein